MQRSGLEQNFLHKWLAFIRLRTYSLTKGTQVHQKIDSQQRLMKEGQMKKNTSPSMMYTPKNSFCTATAQLQGRGLNLLNRKKVTRTYVLNSKIGFLIEP